MKLYLSKSLVRLNIEILQYRENSNTVKTLSNLSFRFFTLHHIVRN